MATRSFSLGLLNLSIKEKEDYFASYTLAHPILKEVYATIMQAIKTPAGAGLVFVYGPTGVGKTTLMARIEKHIKEAALPNLEKDLGQIPIAGIEAVAPDAGNFNWRDYYKRALLALLEPMINSKLKFNAPGVFRNEEGKIAIASRASGADLRMALENALKHRRPAAFLVDEAQHLTKIVSGRKLQDQLDTIKSLANIAGTLHVLFGTYELLAFRNLSAQLSRRSLDVHFRRYMLDSDEDIKAFQNVLFSFQRHLPVAEEPDLLQHWEFCYERSIGCVGILKDWLARALSAALKEKARTITLKHLEQEANSLSKCEKIAKDAIEGEAELTEKAESRMRLRAILGLPSSLQHNPADEQTEQAETSSTTKRRLRWVGKRKPGRDGVGR